MSKLKKPGRKIKTGRKIKINKKPKSAVKTFEAKITVNKPGFILAQRISDGQKFFISGRNSKGFMADDTVMLTEIFKDGKTPEAKAVSLKKEGSSSFVGVYAVTPDGPAVISSCISRHPIAVIGNIDPSLNLKEGDRVIAKVVKRGEKHHYHKCEITSTFGNSGKASSCAAALIKLNAVPDEFSRDNLDFCQSLYADPPASGERLDLRDELIFTIDGADAKDLDDAVSLTIEGEFFRLGVHIADVSHYVGSKTVADKEAFLRGTSIYFPGNVIPMLPTALSDDLCSLNSGEDKLTFSALMVLDKFGKVVSYKFCKTIINSCVRGVYNEVNDILKGTADNEILPKYAPVADTLRNMQDLSLILRKNKIQRGAPQIESDEPIFTLDEQGCAVGLKPRSMGEAENMIEEFMLTANECAARFAVENNLPFVYRVHESPSPEKLEVLRDILQKLGIKSRHIKEGVKAGALAEALDSARGLPSFIIVNKTVLRSMAKARYDDAPLGHFGLALEDYAHFTSPIRRYPDLLIHRIFTAFLENGNTEKYRNFVNKAASQASATEQRAARLEQEIDDIYKAEYMQAHIDEEFDGIISHMGEGWFFVKLPNTAEGLVELQTRYGDEYVYDGMFQLSHKRTGEKWRLGDTVRVVCVSVDIDNGNVNFKLV